MNVEISGGGKVGDEFSGLDNVMNSVLEAVAPRPSNIIPGTQTFEDLEAFLKRKKSEKLEEMKKKLWEVVIVSESEWLLIFRVLFCSLILLKS